jgi:hypothetical protein
VVDHEVADADCADLVVREQRLERPVGLERPVEGAGQGLVEDEQVDVVDAELPAALLEAVQRLLVSVVGDPDLGLEEHLGAVEAGGADRLADLALVAVRGGGVMRTFAERHEFNGKTVLPVTTYAVSGLGTAADEYADACKGATIGRGLAVRGERVRDAGDDIAAWLRPWRVTR